MGPCDDTRRDPGVPRSWRGLSPRDRAVLIAWVSSPELSVLELHTDVPVGEISTELRAAAGHIPERQLEAMYALRIDALVRTSGARMVVECKPWGNAHALGQVLTYQALLRRYGGPWAGSTACVVTCGIDDDIRRVYRRYGVRVVTVGAVLDQ